MNRHHGAFNVNQSDGARVIDRSCFEANIDILGKWDAELVTTMGFSPTNSAISIISLSVSLGLINLTILDSGTPNQIATSAIASALLTSCPKLAPVVINISFGVRRHKRTASANRVSCAGDKIILGKRVVER